MREDAEQLAIEQLAADFPGWRVEHTAAGTGYYSAHRGDGDERENLGSPTIQGLRRMLCRQEGDTFADLSGRIAEAGY